MKFLIDNVFLIAMAIISGGMLLWPTVTRRMGGGVAVGSTEATRMINDRDAVVLDVRPQADFQVGHLPNARNVPLQDVDKRLGDIPAGRPVVVVCGNGVNAAKAAATLRQAGRTDVVTLDGGIDGWQRAGLPLVKG